MGLCSRTGDVCSDVNTLGTCFQKAKVDLYPIFVSLLVVMHAVNTQIVRCKFIVR